MDNPSTVDPASEGNRRIGPGGDLQVVFSCPDCRADGWVYWNQLPQGMKCHSCGGAFWIGTDGTLHSERRAHKIRFHCPRCGCKRLLPAELAGRTVTCPECSLKCLRTAAGSFRAEAQRRAGVGARSFLPRGSIFAWPTVKSPRLLLSGVVAIVLTGAAIVVWSAMSPETAMVEKRAEEFTKLCFQGRMDAIAEYVVAGQGDQLKAWATLAGANGPGSASRSKQPKVRASLIGESTSQAVVRLTVESRSGGKSTHTQCWQKSSDGTWRFDARRTLRSIFRSEN